MSDKCIRFTILGEPASKSNSMKIVKMGKHSSLIKSDKARGYARIAARQIPAAARQMLEGPVCVRIKIFYASERPDLDESIILDVMQAQYKRVKGPLLKLTDGEYGQEQGKRVLVARGVFLNDRQVREKHVLHFIDREHPRAEIEVEPMVPQQAPIELPLPVVSHETNPF